MTTAEEASKDITHGRARNAAHQSRYRQNKKEHQKNRRPSVREKHENGKARKERDSGGEKGDVRRKRRK